MQCECGKKLAVGDKYTRDHEGCILCDGCSPRVVDVLDEKDESWVNDEGETMSVDDRKSFYKCCLMDGMDPQDSLATDTVTQEDLDEEESDFDQEDALPRRVH